MMNKDHICKSGLNWKTEVSFICEAMGAHAEAGTSMEQYAYVHLNGKPMPEAEIERLEKEAEPIRDAKLQDIARRRAEEIGNVRSR